MAAKSLELLHTAGLCEDSEARRICRDTLMVPRCSSVDRRLPLALPHLRVQHGQGETRSGGEKQAGVKSMMLRCEVIASVYGTVHQSYLQLCLSGSRTAAKQQEIRGSSETFCGTNVYQNLFKISIIAAKI